MALSDVSNILWREPQLLELLVLELDEEQLVLDAGRARGLAPATREVEFDRITKSNLEPLARGHQAARQELASMCEIDINAHDARGAAPNRRLLLRTVDEAI